MYILCKLATKYCTLYKNVLLVPVAQEEEKVLPWAPAAILLSSTGRIRRPGLDGGVGGSSS